MGLGSMCALFKRGIKGKDELLYVGCDREMSMLLRFDSLLPLNERVFPGRLGEIMGSPDAETVSKVVRHP